LNTIEIRLPPLRDRREDIPPLAAHFLRQHCEHYRKHLTGFDEPAIKALLAHAWPGCELILVDNTGHDGTTDDMRSSLVAATDRFAGARCAGVR